MKVQVVLGVLMVAVGAPSVFLVRRSVKPDVASTVTAARLSPSERAEDAVHRSSSMPSRTEVAEVAGESPSSARTVPERVPREPDEILDQHFKNFVGNGSRRIALLASLSGEDVLPRLTEELERLYPMQCAELRSRPGLRLSELFAPPVEEDLVAAYENPEVRSLWKLNAELSEVFAAISAYYSRESATQRVEQAPITIHAHLEPWRERIDGNVRRRDELWELIDAYGQNTVLGVSGASDSFVADRDELEARINEILWETRCRRANRMLALMPAETAFWLHLSRVMTPHAYDDSYWMPDDEYDAAVRHYPRYLTEQ